jgi:hypothetical protein
LVPNEAVRSQEQEMRPLKCHEGIEKKAGED